MPQLNQDEIRREWQQRLDSTSPQAAEHLVRVMHSARSELADHFYAVMRSDPEAAPFLDQQTVHERLHGSMQRWLLSLVDARTPSELDAVIALQRQVGEVHARIGVPMHLVLRGVRGLKGRLAELLSADVTESGVATDGLHLFAGLGDLALEVMSYAYASSHDRSARTEEAYRLFSVSQSLGTERERQRAALLDWENQFMFDVALAQPVGALARIAQSCFGLWFRHKGSYAFQGMPEIAQIAAAIERIDDVLLPMFGLHDATSGDRQRLLREVREQTKAVLFLLESVFDQASELEGGRDSLTRLLNRKFLPVVLGKELAYARSSQRGFAVLAIDIDFFKLINDRHGHEAGDHVLQQVAALLVNSCRGGDYVFRMGGEEFLMVLVDIDANSAATAAEKLRRQVERESFRAPRADVLNISVSIGLCQYDGHPDYQRLLRRADEALYAAKHAGRNCVVQV